MPSCQVYSAKSILTESRKVWLLWLAGPQSSTWCYPLHILLRLKKAMKATVYAAAFESVIKMLE